MVGVMFCSFSFYLLYIWFVDEGLYWFLSLADAWVLKACEPGCNILQSESLGCLVLCVDVECVDVEISLMLAVEFDIKSHSTVRTIAMDDA